jgi:hypothetical protein
MTASFTFLYQPYRPLDEADLQPFRQQPALHIARQGRRLLVLEGERQDLQTLAASLGPDWVAHETSTTPFPGPEVHHPVPFPEHLIQATLPRAAPPRSPDLRPARQALPALTDPRRRPLELPALLKTSASSHHKTLPLEASGPKVAQLQVKVALTNGPQGPRLLLSWSAPTRPAHGWLLCLYLPDDDEPLFQRVFSSQHPSADLSQDHIGADLNTTDLRLALWPLQAPLPPA